ncbi:phosphoenolpyruvate synthase [Sorangium sp. So ce131]|uniref:phosphoenolpyruvate synthase n=1 Tax=Sorangium sp. So ce131 TaxID=3133282 RepID=UPI003F616668
MNAAASIPVEHPATPGSGQEGAPWTLPFAQVRARDLPQVGGKGANLGELASAGFPVPAGFCVTTGAYARFLEASGDAAWLWAQLDGLDPHDLPRVQAAGARVRGRLLEVAVPAEIEAAILRAWEAAGAAHAYAVRSSATAEDLPGASFAGQQDTFLNVRGRDALLRAVRACWASLFTDRAILYRIQNGFSHRAVQLSVVVQRMVMPDVSGILFTADPVTGHRHRLTIEASFGLGEALVSGLVTPDRYQLDKRRPGEVEIAVADKQRAIRPLPEGGTREEPLEGPARRARALDDAQIQALARLGAAIERHYGAPQDIEWCLEGGAFSVVQSRPITSLYPLPRPAPGDDRLRVYVCFSQLQVMTDPMPPLAVAVWRRLFPFGKQGDPAAPNPHMLEAGGRLYIDVTPLLLHPVAGKVLPRLLSAGDALAARALGEVAARPELRAEARRPGAAAGAFAVLRWAAPVAGGVAGWLLFRRPEAARARMEALVDRAVRDAADRLAAAPAGPARLRRAFGEVLGGALPPFFRRGVPMVAAGILAFTALRRLVGERARPGDLEALGRGLVGNVTTEMDHAVGDLADVARPYPALAEALRAAAAGAPLGAAAAGAPLGAAAAGAPLGAAAAGAPLEGLRALDGGPGFLRALEDFLGRYGMRGPGEIDLSRRRYRDDPRLILQAVAGNLTQGEVGEHRRRHVRLGELGEEAAARLVAAAREGRFGAVRARAAARLVRIARHQMALREHPKYLMIQLLDLVRREVKAAGEELVRAGRLDGVDDVFLLGEEELLAALEDPGVDLRGPVARARAELSRFERLAPPKVMTSEGECPAATHDAAGLPDGAIVGTAASAGVVEGRARVVLDPARETLLRGEILVAPFTDPGWTPLFINAAGLVMEVGGMMTHGSVVAREYGIPAVVSAAGATQRIRTGQRVRVNGELGYVEILAESGRRRARRGRHERECPSLLFLCPRGVTSRRRVRRALRKVASPP